MGSFRTGRSNVWLQTLMVNPLSFLILFFLHLRPLNLTFQRSKCPSLYTIFPPLSWRYAGGSRGNAADCRLYNAPPPPDPATSRWNAETVADGPDSTGTRGCGRHLLLARQPRSRLKSVGRISRRVRGVLVTITYKYNNNFAVHILIQKDGGQQT